VENIEWHIFIFVFIVDLRFQSFKNKALRPSENRLEK